MSYLVWMRPRPAGWMLKATLIAWTAWGMSCVILMFLRPGEQTIPYHLGWAGFALAFGLGTWSKWQLVTAMTWYTLATGVALERGWLLGKSAGSRPPRYR